MYEGALIIEEKSGKLNLYLAAMATFWSSLREFAHCCHLYSAAIKRLLHLDYDEEN